MTEVVALQTGRTGSSFSSRVQTVIVHDGRRGKQGVTGDEGDTGPEGPGIVSRGAWVSGFEYCPLDMVTAPSSTGVAGVTSSYIQKSSWDCGVSTVSPELDPARWDEVGYTDFGDALGNIWEVTQVGHGFTMRGTGVQFDSGAGNYIPSDVSNIDTIPVAVIHDVIDADNFILQSSGLLVEPDPGITTDGPFELDTVYYARPSGLCAKTPPGTGLIVPILRYLDGDAIVFPHQLWDQVPAPDPVPAPATTHLKLDDIAAGFDGSALQFPLLSGAAPVPFGPAESMRIALDGNMQEPLRDFSIVDVGGNAEILFPEAPEYYVNFWGVYAV